MMYSETDTFEGEYCSFVEGSDNSLDSLKEASSERTGQNISSVSGKEELIQNVLSKQQTQVQYETDGKQDNYTHGSREIIGYADTKNLVEVCAILPKTVNVLTDNLAGDKYDGDFSHDCHDKHNDVSILPKLETVEDTDVDLVKNSSNSLPPHLRNKRKNNVAKKRTYRYSQQIQGSKRPKHCGNNFERSVISTSNITCTYVDIDRILLNQPRVCLEQLDITGLDIPCYSDDTLKTDDEHLQKQCQEMSVLMECVNFLQCPFCKRTFERFSNLQTHIHKMHPDLSLPYQCRICKLFFLRGTNLEQHLQTKHNAQYKDVKLESQQISPKKLSQLNCNQKKDKADDLLKGKKYMVISKENEEKYLSEGSSPDVMLQCPKCSESVTWENKEMLEEHHRKVHGIQDMPYICRQCPCRGFFLKMTCKTHCKKWHHSKIEQINERTAWCIAIPMKEYQDNTNTKQIVTPLSCPLCKVEFVNKSQLNNHLIKGHSIFRADLGKYDITGSEEQTKVDMDKYDEEQILGASQNNICPRCNKTFTSLAMLEAHIRLLHKEKDLTFSCNICSKRFFTLAGKTKHSLHTHKSMHKTIAKGKISSFKVDCQRNNVASIGENLAADRKVPKKRIHKRFQRKPSKKKKVPTATLR